MGDLSILIRIEEGGHYQRKLGRMICLVGFCYSKVDSNEVNRFQIISTYNTLLQDAYIETML